MSRIEDYKQHLLSLAEWDEYLLAESNLPGARGNLELAQATAMLGSREQFLSWIEWTADRAPENTQHCFLAFCGTYGLGRLIAEGERQWVPVLRRQAKDRRWRVREAAAMALQITGDANLDLLLQIVSEWKTGTLLEQRAVVAGLCEPRLLLAPAFRQAVLDILDGITAAMAAAAAVDKEELRVLRQALGYGWSVAIVSDPPYGKPLFEKWAESAHPDIRWMVKENLKKNRLLKMDAAWVRKIDILP